MPRFFLSNVGTNGKKQCGFDDVVIGVPGDRKVTQWDVVTEGDTSNPISPTPFKSFLNIDGRVQA